jgi:hypothetical protein
MRRPTLRQIPIDETLSELTNGKGQVITMSVGQWDAMLYAAYNTGWTLLELDKDENPVAGYRKGGDNEIRRA